jgi:hypothetical protein
LRGYCGQAFLLIGFRCIFATKKNAIKDRTPGFTFGDVVTLSRANAPPVSVMVGVERPEGGFYVHDITGSLSGPVSFVPEAAA